MTNSRSVLTGGVCNGVDGELEPHVPADVGATTGSYGQPALGVVDSKGRDQT